MNKGTSKEHLKSPCEISVIICTYNRKELLKKVIDNVVNQTIDKLRYEIVIVDNGSRDGAQKLISSWQSKYKKPRIVFLQEKRLGLGYSRNRGLGKATGEYIAFLDDDVSVDKDWLETILGCFREVKVEPFAVGGQIYPRFKFKKPLWFKDKYAAVSFGEVARYLKKGESFSASNMIFRKKILGSFGGFNTQVGMKGDFISVGEETSIFEKIWDKYGDGKFFYYCPNIIVYHYISSYKTKISYQLKRYFAAGQAWYIRHRQKYICQKLVISFKIFLGICLYSFLAIVNVARYKRYQNWMVERWEKPVTFFGALLGVLGVELKVRQERV